MQILDKIFTPYIPHKEIQSRTKEIALTIDKDYRDKDPLFIVLLNGAFMFAADLIRHISIPCQVSFVKVSSYRDMQSTGQVTEVLGLQEDIAGRNLILVDDIVDTGETMKMMMAQLADRQPATVEIASLLLKPEAFKDQFRIKYTGFSIPNKFVVGYGLDYNGYGRNLQDILQYNP